MFINFIETAKVISNISWAMRSSYGPLPLHAGIPKWTNLPPFTSKPYQYQCIMRLITLCSCGCGFFSLFRRIVLVLLQTIFVYCNSLFLWNHALFFYFQLCLELRNFNAVMAIIVAALGSAPVRRLHKTKEVRLQGLLNLASVCIFSILFSLHFLRCWRGEFV